MTEGVEATRVPWLLIAVPVGAFAGYVSWLIVPVVVQRVVPAVIRATFGA